MYAPKLTMIDDLLGVTTCIVEAIKLNAILNVKIESKKLRFSSDKCYKLHIGKKEKCNHKLKARDTDKKKVKTAKYLGDILNENGTIDNTIADRKSKSKGIISQISTILDSITFGLYYVDTALVLREAILINDILTKSGRSFLH